MNPKKQLVYKLNSSSKTEPGRVGPLNFYNNADGGKAKMLELWRAASIGKKYFVNTKIEKKRIRRITAFAILMALELQSVINTKASCLKLTRLINERITELLGPGLYLSRTDIVELIRHWDIAQEKVKSPIRGKLMLATNVSDRALEMLRMSKNPGPYRKTYSAAYKLFESLESSSLLNFELDG